MGTLTTQYFLVIFIGIGLCILFLKPAENFYTPSWKGQRPYALPWGGWDLLDRPNPMAPISFPPANGGEPWQEPLLLAYGGSPTPHCGPRQKGNTC